MDEEGRWEGEDCQWEDAEGVDRRCRWEGEALDRRRGEAGLEEEDSVLPCTMILGGGGEGRWDRWEVPREGEWAITNHQGG